MSLKKLFLTCIILTTISLFAREGFEYKGISVRSVDMDGNVREIIVKRDIPKICNRVPVDNKMLWTGNYAHTNVPEACKSTYVHTKGKLLPMQLDADLETYGELEVLATLSEMKNNPNLVLIDGRKEEWFSYRTIPGAINMPFYYFRDKKDYEFHVEYALKYLNVKKDKNGVYQFKKAKILIIFCNGPWCSQSPTMIFALLEMGYPADKLKWYRGGMQDWLSAGMTATRP